METLHKLVETAGFVTTVQTSISLEETIGTIVEAAPRLSEDHEISPSGLIVSRVGMYRIIWGVVRHPGGSLAVLAPIPEDEKRSPNWTSHYRREVLDPILALSHHGHLTGGGGHGAVTEEEFARAFRNAYI
ncbi:hypothetical protein ACIF8T_39210 [Streptomyces sp. NPDC085946]|uniref:hypothetical protein n=1 Tax=Streptomyces sp. NPDC085946 TaxID=3365744 RepID=UPI0037D083DB